MQNLRLLVLYLSNASPSHNNGDRRRRLVAKFHRILEDQYLGELNARVWRAIRSSKGKASDRNSIYIDNFPSGTLSSLLHATR